MIDFHNHVLPNVDDGPESIAQSINMLDCAFKQGITDVVNTVHYQHPKMLGKNVEYEYLNNKIEELQSAIFKKDIKVKLHLAAEVFYLPNLVKITNNPLLTIGNGKYVLIEFATNIFPSGYEDEFFHLQSEGISPIIAHPERYRFIQKDISLLEVWIDRGYIIQIDAGSILGHFGEKIKKITLSMINNGFIHLIGSDAHNDKNRNFCIKNAYDIIENKISTNFINYLKKNANNILRGKNIMDLL